MSTIPLSTSSTTPEAILCSDDPTSDSYILEIMAYFISRGFQPSLVRSFLERNCHLDLKTNEHLMFDFLEEREQLDPVIFVGIEGSGVNGIESGEDEKLLVKWGLTDETARELRQSVRDDDLWSQQILYH
ncbi:16619_t:CDS:1 [Funneliformis geosporum]|nr:16619_t:CDS:1 [Funneliformis geosporum]